MGSCLSGAVKPGYFGDGFSQAVALKDQPVGVVDEPVEDGIGDSGIANDVVPMIDRQLAGQER